MGTSGGCDYRSRCIAGFPIARHAYEDLRLKEDDPFKIIYGVEGYFVDDLGDLIIDSKGQSLMDSYVVFDIETTGFNSVNDRIIEIGAVRVVEGEIKETFSEFVNPERPIPYKITQLTTITDDMVKDAGTIEEILPQFLKFCEDLFWLHIMQDLIQGLSAKMRKG